MGVSNKKGLLDRQTYNPYKTRERERETVGSSIYPQNARKAGDSGSLATKLHLSFCLDSSEPDFCVVSLPKKRNAALKNNIFARPILSL